MIAVKTEVYSRVVGYYRPVEKWNEGKREEFRERNYLNTNGGKSEKGKPNT